MRLFWLIILLLITLQVTTGQAPGDEDDACLIAQNPFVNQIILMSSSKYSDLLDSNEGPWVAISNDTSDNKTWVQQGKACTRNANVCEFRHSPQDNWLITQFINNTMRQPDIYINLRYSFSSVCVIFPDCLTKLDVYTFQTNESNQNLIRNNVYESILVQSLTIEKEFFSSAARENPIIFNHIIRVSANLSTTGFYLVFRDLGTCIHLLEVSVFYPVCDAFSLDFSANFTATRFPGENSTGLCFNNMAIDLDSPNDPFSATCTLSFSQESVLQSKLFTNWVISDGPSQCMCLPGYIFMNGSSPSTQCQACPPFAFKSTLSNNDMCQPCPLYSNTTENDMGMIMCPCIDGYFRPLDGSEDSLPCTRPPSMPQNISVSRVDANSVLLRWETPEDSGSRSDLFYTVSQNVTSSIYITNNTHITLTDLIPSIYYELHVTADNGVSSQDNNTKSRTAHISIIAIEGRTIIISEGGSNPSTSPLVIAISAVVSILVILGAIIVVVMLYLIYKFKRKKLLSADTAYVERN